jgi:hypothetical protein
MPGEIIPEIMGEGNDDENFMGCKDISKGADGTTTMDVKWRSSREFDMQP